jgi:mono/diheme cytochrome c family protein
MTRYLKIVAQALVVCIGLAVLFLPTLCARGAWQQQSSRVRKVDELYNRNCARCHGAEGRGDTPQGEIFNAPDFTDLDWWKKNASTTKQLRAAVSRGKAGMPAFGKKLTRAEINLLVDRVRTFRK